MSSNKEISCSGTCWIETHVETKCEPPLIFKWILHPFTCHPPKYFSANWARDSWMKICFLYWSLPLPFSQNGDYIFWGLAFHKTLHQQTSTRKILQSRRGNAKRELNRKPRTYICGSTHTHHPLAEIGRSQRVRVSLRPSSSIINSPPEQLNLPALQSQSETTINRKWPTSGLGEEIARSKERGMKNRTEQLTDQDQLV